MVILEKTGMLPHGLGYGAAAEHGLKIGRTGEKDNWLICIVNQMELSIKQALGTGTACPELSGSECFFESAAPLFIQTFVSYETMKRIYIYKKYLCSKV